MSVCMYFYEVPQTLHEIRRNYREDFGKGVCTVSADAAKRADSVMYAAFVLI